MKNFLKSTFIIASLFLLNSCENDKEFIASPQGFTLTKDPEVLSPSTLIESNNASNYAKFVWEEANYGVQSSSSYKLFINDAGADPTATNSIEIPSTFTEAGNSISTIINIEKLNNALNALPSFKCGSMSINFRVKSILGDPKSNAISQFSTPVNVNVIAYTLKIPTLSIVQTNNISNAKSAPFLMSSSRLSKNDLEGYVYLTAGNYKFYQPDACGEFISPTTYGGSAGTLSTTGSDIVIANTGHYFVKADLVANTYSITEFRALGLYGVARVSSLANNAAIMNDTNLDNKWSLEVYLFPRKTIKFKTNNWVGAASTSGFQAASAGPPPVPAIAAIPTVPSPNATNMASIITALGNSGTDGILKEAFSPLLDNTSNPSLTTEQLALITVPGTVGAPKSKFLVEVDLSKPRNYTYKITPQP